MKIIHVVLGKANPDRMNGVNKVVHSLATQQHLLGADVEVWGITPTPFDHVSGRIYSTRLFQSIENKLCLDKQLKDAIKEEAMDTMFHLHGGFIPEFSILSRVIKKNGKQYVITAHGNYMQGAMNKNSFFKRMYFKFSENNLLRNALFIHCIGSGEITDIRKLYNFNNIVLIPNGQDFDTFDFEVHKISVQEKPVFGFCGRVTMYQKGLDLLLEAFKLYKHTNHGIGQMWLIGDGDYLESIREYVLKHNLQDSVILYGSKFGEEKLNLMANMDVFYHPSRNEGLPMAVLEASVLGKPLVVSQYTNMTEYVSKYNAGICLKDNTAEEIAESMCLIARMKDSDEFISWGKNSRTMAEEQFDWKIIAQRILNAYVKPPFDTNA